ncbi:MAG: hypothetical protein O7D91_11505 [Planctomycetota bacterium]|nr:hypothetical protein [Planctomycetota bacterium]
MMANTITLQELKQEIQKLKKAMVTKQELESLLETMAILSNPETMRQIEVSEQDVRQGRFTEIDSIHELL